jgi:hypothetical protein
MIMAELGNDHIFVRNDGSAVSVIWTSGSNAWDRVSDIETTGLRETGTVQC